MNLKLNQGMLRKGIVMMVFISISLMISAQKSHPCLLLTPAGVEEIRLSKGISADFDRSVEDIRIQSESALKAGIVVPVPVDGGGGYTHEKHKDNYYAMFNAGIMYQLTGDNRYATFAKDMLLEYARLYPTLGLHPAVRSATPGKLFWQALNECVWLVHTSNAYDCIYEALSPADRQTIEANLFRPMALFIAEGNKNNINTFNKMHNHATWATASVGMIGYVMGDNELVEKALHGTDKSGKGGFLKQLQELFSPDGYYAEGAYYQRYALWPFVTFAQAIDHNQPELDIFGVRGRILEKALNSLLNQAYNGQLFYLNDALDKTYQTQEIIYASNILYGSNPTNEDVLNIIAFQQKFLVADAGIRAAKAIAQIGSKEMNFKSLFLRDGANGNRGGLAILRSGQDDKQSCLTFKATSHGLSHGHFDKLSLTWFDNGNSVIQDYGSARFLNLVTKFGGHYTPENKSWAKQTIAHNTVVVDQTSHFNGDMDESEKYHPEILFYDDKDPIVQIVSATDRNATPGVVMNRTVALISDPDFDYPFIVDCFGLNSEKEHTYDYPFYYLGHLTHSNFKMQRNVDTMTSLGKANGYEHLWVEGRGVNKEPVHAFTWVNGNRFYTITTLSDPKDELILARIGANDPNSHLRNDPAYIIRRNGCTNTSFISVIEPHGNYDLVKEVTSGYLSSLKELQQVAGDNKYMAFRMTFEGKGNYLLILAREATGKKQSLKIAKTTYKWDGAYLWTKEK